MRKADYLLILGPHDALAARATAARHAADRLGLPAETEGPGFLLRHGSELPVHRLTPGALALGRILPARPGIRLATHAVAIAASPGRLLIDDFWGDYVAWFAAPGGPGQLLRSPSAGLNAYQARADGLTWVASDAALLVDVGAVTASPDWSFVAQHLRFRNLAGARTGLTGVSEVSPGCLADLGSADSSGRLLWSPWTFAAPERQVHRFEEASALVRETVCHAVQALSARHQSLLLELSGGLDSSILAAALARSAVPATAVNLATAATEGDERAFARLTAERTRLPLEEYVLPDDFDLTQVPMPRKARPGMPLVLSQVDCLLKSAGMTREIDAFVSGGGGDAVFCSLRSPVPVVDITQSRGLGLSSVRTFFDVVRLHEATLFQVARIAWRQWRHGPLALRWPASPTFLLDDPSAEPPFHPWLEEPADARAGTRSHIRGLLSTLAHLDGFDRQTVAPMIFPLLSQPVMEACLAIPSWLWVHGGQDRAVARNAFASLLPARVLARRGKGTIDSYCIRNFTLNLARIRPFLLDGLLLQSDLIDRKALLAALAADHPDGDTVYRVLPLLDMEAWLRAWSL